MHDGFDQKNFYQLESGEWLACHLRFVCLNAFQFYCACTSALLVCFTLQSAKGMEGYVGFANLPNQVFRKSVKKGFEFTIMVVGRYPYNKTEEKYVLTN